MRYLFGGVSEVGKAVGHRLDDAEVLLSKGRWRGAMYMAGYVVECKLKAKLMRKYGCDNLNQLGTLLAEKSRIDRPDDIYTHALEILLRLTDRRESLQSTDALWRQFVVVNGWLPAWRYTADRSNPDEATDFVDAARTIAAWIENNV